jgi:hypothetical protein
MCQKNLKIVFLNKCILNILNINIKEIEAIVVKIENIKNMNIIIEKIVVKVV